MKTRPPRKQGFTLIELLVVVAILAVLAALLFPVFAQAREKGRSAVCISNLKQIGMAFQLYADAHEVAFHEMPVVIQAPPEPGERPGSDQLYRWPALLLPYLQSQDVFVCPSNIWMAAWADWLNAIDATDNETSVSSGMSYTSFCGSDWGQPLEFGCKSHRSSGSGPAYVEKFVQYTLQNGYGLSGLLVHLDGRDPAGAILIGEIRVPINVNNPYVEPGYATGDATMSLRDGARDNILPPLPRGGGYIQTHNKRTNWLFCDGHVRALTVKQTLTPANMWTTRAIDQRGFNSAAAQLRPEYR